MELLYKEEVYTIIGHCIEVWKNLGYGFSEIVYKDAMEIEFCDCRTPYLRETELPVLYKGICLRHKFKVDFLLFGKIIVEVKCGDDIFLERSIAQILNYLKASGCRVGLLINFGKSKMSFKRLIL